MQLHTDTDGTQGERSTVGSLWGGWEEGAKSKGEVQRSGRAAGAANTIVVRLAIGLTPKYQVIAVERGKTNLLTTIPPSYECRCTS